MLHHKADNIEQTLKKPDKKSQPQSEHHEVNLIRVPIQTETHKKKIYINAFVAHEEKIVI